MQDFQTRLKKNAESVEACLEDVLSDVALETETSRPERLLSAMRHSALDGGKRLRPFLLIEVANLLGGDVTQAVQAGAALELIHCYSLVHDDLPAMDDDDLRRGRPTTHIAFDEATAILAGDALLTLAFDVLSRETVHPDGNVRIELVRLYARNAGLGGMAGGQMLDLEAETKDLSEQQIVTLQAMKTGALIRCACEAGAIIGRATANERAHLLEFGSIIGQAFQLADDILDVTSDAKTMGKKTGKDSAKHKGTLVGLYGLEESQIRAASLLDQALKSLDTFGDRADILRAAAEFTVRRKN